jgi:hypothetical protein
MLWDRCHAFWPCQPAGLSWPTHLSCNGTCGLSWPPTPSFPRAAARLKQLYTVYLSLSRLNVPCLTSSLFYINLRYTNIVRHAFSQNIAHLSTCALSFALCCAIHNDRAHIMASVPQTFIIEDSSIIPAPIMDTILPTAIVLIKSIAVSHQNAPWAPQLITTT